MAEERSARHHFAVVSKIKDAIIANRARAVMAGGALMCSLAILPLAAGVRPQAGASHGPEASALNGPRIAAPALTIPDGILLLAGDAGRDMSAAARAFYAEVASLATLPPRRPDDGLVLPRLGGLITPANAAPAMPPPAIDLDSRLALGLQPIDLDEVRDGQADVPRQFLDSLPTDLQSLPPSDERKAAFVKALLPLLLKANEQIREDRARLLALAADLGAGSMDLVDADRAWLEELADRYGTSPTNIGELKRRVDVVPPSLAIAQAAEETGWGQARAAHTRNALFGEMTVAANGRVQVRAFDGLEQAVQAYVANLNSHKAYASLRGVRADLRRQAREPSGYAMAAGLHRYSERGQDYVRTIRGLIKSNGLDDFDQARLNANGLADNGALAVWR